MTKMQKYQKKWYQKNKARHDAAGKKWRADNAERQIFLSARWYQNNKEKHIRRTVRNAKIRKENPAERLRLREYNLGRYWKDVEASRKRSRENARAWTAANPKRKKELQRRCLYGIEPGELRALKKLQRNKCPICENRLGRRFHVDHCHDSKKVRGLLCGTCNTGIGMLGDSSKICLKASEYLKGGSR